MTMVMIDSSKSNNAYSVAQYILKQLCIMEL